MKMILTMTVFLWTFIGSTYADDKGKHLFILSGQSNMDRLRPEISFTPTVEKKFGKDNIIVVKDAKGGAPIKMWLKKGEKSGPLYDRLIAKVKEATKDKKIKTITFVWMQGESDSGRNGKNYATDLRELLGQVRTDLKTKDINVVIGRISDYSNEKRFPQWDLVRAALVEVAESEPSGAWVNTDDLNDKKKKDKLVNDLHYTREGYKTLGLRFATKAIELIEKNDQKK